MGCSNERTVEGKKNSNNGYPVCRLTIPLEGEVDAMTAYNEKKLVLGCQNKLQLFEAENKSITTISSQSKEHKRRINCLIKLSNGNIASGGQDTTIKIWDIEKKDLITTLEGHTSMIWEIGELKGNKLISGGDDRLSKIWDLKTKKGEDFCKTNNHISGIAILKNNKVIIASGKNIFLYDLQTKQQESFLDIAVWSLKVLSNGDVACGLGNGLLYTITVTDEILIKTKFPRGHNKTINFIIELDNHKIVTSSDENDLILWDPQDPESIYFLKGHTDIVTSLCFISGTRFASASRDKTLKIWE
jgi:WD40 repeat protein